MNIFHKPFLGCFQGIQISSFNSNNNRLKTTTPSTSHFVKSAQVSSFNNQDFSRFVGENIGECELFDEFVNSDMNSLFRMEMH